MTNRLLALMMFGALLGAATVLAVPARSDPLNDVVAQLRSSGGRYVRAGASLRASDCSGLVSVAQSLAMGQQPHRLGNTSSLIAGHWPGVIAGASPEDAFVIGANRGHMVASIEGVNIESSTSGQPYRFGSDAASPFDARFPHRYHVDPSLLVHL